MTTLAHALQRYLLCRMFTFDPKVECAAVVATYDWYAQIER
jgi:hypothetical protein